MASNSNHQISTNVLTISRLFLVRPEFVKEPVDQIVSLHNNITFVCNVSGVPSPDIIWSFNGGESLPLLSETNAGGVLSLFLVKNTAEYEGNYTCTAVNRAGINNSTAKLTVDGKWY